MKTTSSIEPLEARIAPAMLATLLVNGLSATYTDVDGDRVTVKVSTGIFTAALFSGVAGAHGDQLQLLNLSAGGFDGANLTFTVAKVAGGNGFANIGYINSAGHDLGKVTIKGDLGQIDAGSGTSTGLKSLSAQSLGRLGLDTQAAGGSQQSDINGPLGALQISGDLKGYLNVTGGLIGTIGKITIGGSVIGGGAISSGTIQSSGDMGAVKIGGDVQGGSAISSGIVQSFQKIASLSIGGSIIGGSALQTGKVLSGSDLGAVKIGHNVQGGSGSSSGMIASSGKLQSVSIGGSVLGGSNTSSGEIFSSLDMGAVKIAHDLIGGSITGSASLDSSGLILSTKRIASVTIGGSIVSGIDTSTGALLSNASIRAADDLGSLTVKGSLIGNATSPVVIAARGQAVQGTATDLAIGKISIGGSVEYANILAGYGFTAQPQNGDAQIGAVKVSGNWASSNLVAGTKNLGADNATGGVGANADNLNFGDSHDFSIGAGTAGIVAKIASITIGGQVFGTPASVSPADHFGFVAAQIGTLKIKGNAIVLAATSQPIGETTDMTAHKV